ncbi:MAG: hypothetical protein ACR2NM_02060 [Bythopirellula sp.]
MPVCDQPVVIDEPCCTHGCCLGMCLRKCCPCLEAGPPPEPYQPPMPPKFLPVPACSVFSNVNMAAPTRKRGQVEMGFGNAYGHEMAFPAGD